MTITISQQAYWELFQEVEETARYDPSDPLDVTWQYPQQLGQGYVREIQLREGLELEIINFWLQDRLIINLPERPNWLRYHFHLFGQHEDKYTKVGNKEYALYGSGLAPEETNDGPEQHALEVTIYVQPKILYSFIGGSDNQLPSELQQLVRPLEKECYSRVATIKPTMQSILWQIIRGPYRGITKRIYLESKALELISLAIEQEIEIQRQERPEEPLKPGTIERIHHARTILLQNLYDPPSLSNLAQQVKLNEYTLKRGFRQVFGTTVFGYLHDYRLEQARQLLETGHMKVIEVVEAVGFSDRSYFAAAFRKKFGVNPKKYLMQRQSF